MNIVNSEGSGLSFSLYLYDASVFFRSSLKFVQGSYLLIRDYTDMDSKIKLMIKIIEEDAESFAKKAEMYYRRRPELMALLEELYRAYRALAERYDHAAGDLRQAHKKIAEAFPDQVLMDPDDDLPAESATTETDQDNAEMARYFLSFMNSGDPKMHGKGKSF